MALTFLKPSKILTESVTQVEQKLLVPPVVTYDLTEAQALAQEYLILHEKLLEIGGKEFLKRMEALRKQLQSIAYETVPDNQPAIFSCDKGMVIFGERGEMVEITHPKELIDYLDDKFGEDVAWSVVSILLTPLRKILSEHEIAQVSEKKPGTRILKDMVLKK